MADISTALSQYLGSFSKQRWRPGTLDCGVFMADWVELVCGQDPIADVRGTYSSEAEFEQILEREMGFLRSCADRLRRVGFVRTRTPAAGDIAAVMAPYEIRNGEIVKRPTGAICVTDKLRAVITSDLGVVIAGGDALPLIRAFKYA